MPKFQVHLVHKETKFYLRYTTWSFDPDRADNFQTEERARAALEGARKYMPPSIYRRAYIVTIQELT